MMRKLEISEEEFFRYFSLDYHRIADTSPQKWYAYSGLDSSTIQDLDLLQEKVGPAIFQIIYEQLDAGDAEFLALFRDQEFLNATVRFWNEYRKNTEPLREHANSGDNFLTQNRDNRIPNVISEDILVSQTDANFPSSATCQSHVIKTSGLNDSDSNFCADDGAVKTVHKILKNSGSLTDLSKVQSINPNDISETMLKKFSSILQSTNQDKEIQSSFGSFQDYPDKPNGSQNPVSIMLPHNQNSDGQNEDKSSKMHSLKSRNSPNNATHSDHNFKEKPRDDKSGKSNEVLENVSNVQLGVRKNNSQDDAKSRKKIRFQENLNTGQTESKKEESPRKDESKTSSQGSVPGKPGNKSCIVM